MEAVLNFILRTMILSTIAAFILVLALIKGIFGIGAQVAGSGAAVGVIVTILVLVLVGYVILLLL